MKKLTYVFVCLIAFLMCFNFGTSSYAADLMSDEQIKSQIERNIVDFVEDGAEEKTRTYRVPGSTGEKSAALYLYSKLSELKNFKPVTNTSTNNGFQTFNFISTYDEKNYISQNIVFRKNSSANAHKKVILCANYDTTFTYDYSNNDLGIGVGVVEQGVNDNGASVGLLLALASYFDECDDLGFDIEILFLGAGSNDFEGAKFYSRGLSDEDAQNILLLINFDKIALGQNTYMYVNEFSTPQEKYYKKLLASNGLRQLTRGNYVTVNQQTESGLDYTHIGLDGDHSIFMARHINVLNFFSGYYEKPLTYGVCEYEKGDRITYTKNDNLTYIRQNHPDYINNIVRIYKSVTTLLGDGQFIDEMAQGNSTEGLYRFYTNENLAVILTAVTFFVFIFIYYLIFRSLKKKSKQTLSDSNVQKIVEQIAKNFDLDDEELNSAIDNKIKDDTKKDDDKD